LATPAALAWDGTDFVLSGAVVVYLYRLRAVFRGGRVSKSFDYFLAATVVACVAFGARIVLDTSAVGSGAAVVSVRDLGASVVLLVVLLGLRDVAKIWPRYG
jgi:hypothetical protein